VKPIQTILVVVDRTMHATPALRRGIELARRARARLHLCLCDHDALIDAGADLIPPQQAQRLKARFIERRRGWLQQTARELGAQGLDVHIDSRWAPSLHEALIDRALALRPDLVIKDVGQDPASAPGALSPADWKLLRFCPAPLMLVHPQSAPLPRRILAAVDTAHSHGPLNDTIVGMAQRLGLYADARIDLAHVFSLRPAGSDAPHDLQALHEDLRREDRDAFTAFAARHGVDAEHQQLRIGDPARTLNELVVQTASDLLVLGALYRNSADRFFLGATTEAMISCGSCDILLVRMPHHTIELAGVFDLDVLQRRQSLLQRIPAPLEIG
jgi:universal stress protein E